MYFAAATVSAEAAVAKIPDLSKEEPQQCPPESGWSPCALTSLVDPMSYFKDVHAGPLELTRRRLLQALALAIATVCDVFRLLSRRMRTT